MKNEKPSLLLRVLYIWRQFKHRRNLKRFRSWLEAHQPRLATGIDYDAEIANIEELERKRIPQSSTSFME